MKNQCKKQRELIVETVHKSKWSGHLSSSMSMVEIINVLFEEIIDTSSYHIGDKEIVLSKGHAGLGLYAYMACKNIITKEDLFTYNQRNSNFGTHPCRHKVPGLDVSTGSLGHGLPIAIGIAFANKLNKKNKTVYVIAGDGEMNEGSMWESLLIASRIKGLNVSIIIDNNGLEEKGSNCTFELEKKIEAFGWNSYTCDGHDENDLKNTFLNTKLGLNVIIANTIKGKGFSRMEREPEEWHYRTVSDEEYISLLGETS
tara:strand:+ start:86 stop:856 length:771 start_codon:yes stop_codon:yes gene_type:complete